MDDVLPLENVMLIHKQLVVAGHYLDKLGQRLRDCIILVFELK